MPSSFRQMGSVVLYFISHTITHFVTMNHHTGRLINADPCNSGGEESHMSSSIPSLTGRNVVPFLVKAEIK